MKRCSKPSIITEIHIITIIRYCYMCIRKPEVKQTDNDQVSVRCEASGTPVHCW